MAQFINCAIHTAKGKQRFGQTVRRHILISAVIIISLLFAVFTVIVLNKTTLSTQLVISQAERYFPNIKLSVETINFSEITISYIQALNLSIDRISIKYNIKNYFFNKGSLVEHISIKAPLLDLDTLLNQRSTNDTKMTKESFSLSKQINQFCTIIGQIKLDLSLDHIWWHNQKHPVNFQIKSSIQNRGLDLSTHLSLTPLNDSTEILPLKSLHANGKLFATCIEQKISVKIENLAMKLVGLTNKKHPNFNLSLKLNSSSLSATEDKFSLFSKIEGGSGDLFSGKIRRTIEVNNSTIELSGTIKDMSFWPQKMQASTGKIKGSYSGYNFSSDSSKFKVTSNKEKTSSMVGNISHISAMDSNKPLVDGVKLNFKGQLFQDKTAQLNFKLSTPSKDLKPIELSVSASLPTKSIKVTLDKYSLNIQSLNQLKWLPLATKNLNTFSGKLDFTGHFDSRSPEKMRLLLAGKNISLTSKDLSVSNINFHQTIQNLNSPSGLPKDFFHTKSITIGETVSDFKLSHTMKSKEKLYIDSMSWSYKGAKFTILPTTVTKSPLAITPTSIEIKGLKVETLLKLIYDQGVYATGAIEGTLPVQVTNSTPTVKKGSLTSNEKGVIRVRPPGSKPPDPKEIPTDTAKILKNYLYDFRYSKINASISTDQNYDLGMTLSIFGNNPGYLDGKPLKLSVNLSLNILGMIKSAMASYDLPEGLKKRLSRQSTDR